MGEDLGLASQQNLTSSSPSPAADATQGEGSKSSPATASAANLPAPEAAAAGNETAAAPSPSPVEVAPIPSPAGVTAVDASPLILNDTVAEANTTGPDAGAVVDSPLLDTSPPPTASPIIPSPASDDATISGAPADSQECVGLCGEAWI